MQILDAMQDLIKNGIEEYAENLEGQMAIMPIQLISYLSGKQ